MHNLVESTAQTNCMDESSILSHTTYHTAPLLLLSQLEEMEWIKVLNEGSVTPVSMELKKFRGILTKEQGKELQKHIQTFRNEWGG